MSLESRVDRLEKSISTSDATQSSRAWGDPMPRYWGDVSIQSWDTDCICFAVQPQFHNELELEKALALTCPLHGLRFTLYEPIMWKSRWIRNRWLESDEASQETETKHWYPQQQKAWVATFPVGFLPVEEYFQDGLTGMRFREVTLAEWIRLEEAQDRREIELNAITPEQAAHRMAKRKKYFGRWL